MRANFFPVLLSLFAAARASPITREAKPPYFLLVGDSTVVDGGGWGSGFLPFLKDPADGSNRAKSGTTTVSWKSNGRYKDLLETLEERKDDYETIVTLQFGHNDQKGMTLDEYEVNLTSLINGVKDAGGVPVSFLPRRSHKVQRLTSQIVVTSLTRRNFIDGEVRQDLKDWAARAIQVAEDTGVEHLDLNTASTTYVNAIGADNAKAYNLNGSDKTHLSPAGSAVFGRMTIDLLLEKREDLAEYFETNEALSDKIANGEFATGDE